MKDREHLGIKKIGKSLSPCTHYFDGIQTCFLAPAVWISPVTIGAQGGVTFSFRIVTKISENINSSLVCISRPEANINLKFFSPLLKKPNLTI